VRNKSKLALTLVGTGALLLASVAAVAAIPGYKGLEGTYDFDSRGDGLHGYNVVKNDGGKIVFIKRVDFPVE